MLGRVGEGADDLELKVLPTQPEHPAIPEEEGDDEDAHECAKAEDDESEGVEVSCCFGGWRVR